MAKTHTVKKGETLNKIATFYNVSVKDLQRANANLIKNVNKIQTGWKLTIPTSNSNSKGFEEIGRQFQKALNDIRNVSSVEKLVEMIGD